VAFLIGSYWGLFGICIAWLIASPLHLFSLLRRVALVTNTPVMSLIQPLLPPLAGSLIMYIAVHIIEAALSSGANQLNSLFLLSMAGAVIYFSYSLLFLRPIFGEFLNLVRR
jgi:hypothetical protein